MRKDTTIGILCIATVVVYVLGMVFWPYMPKESQLLSKLYYLTTSSVLYIMSVIINIVAQTKWVRIGSFAAMGAFSVNLYVELFLDPEKWTKWSVGLLIIVPLNMLIMGYVINKIKSKK